MSSPARKHGHWLIAVVVVVPTFMEVLDTTIANVALRYIAGGLSAAEVDAEWVITSYLAANAIVLSMSGWLQVRLGRRNYLLLSIAGFTLSSLMCGLSRSLGELVFFRVLQGLFGGGLQPCTQGILLDTFPKEKQGQGLTAFALAALVAPVIGPTLGGYITDNYSWRWIFFINVPVGLLALAACYGLVHDPEYLQAQRAQAGKNPVGFDTIVAFLLGRGTDARRLVIAGLVLMAIGNFWLSRMNLEIGPWDVVWPRVVTIAGLALLITPLNVAVHQSVPLHLRGAAVGLFSLLRNEGGSVGTSMAQTIRERREQFHLLRLNEYVDPLNPNLQGYLARLWSNLTPIFGGSTTTEAMSYQVIDNLRQQQATSLAYFDVFWVFAGIAVVLIGFAILMRRSVAEKGASLAAE